MIKFFVRDSKLNAVDDKNRIVGFDLDDDCCAFGGWFISDSIVRKYPGYELEVNLADLPKYEFDPEFFERVISDGYMNEYGAVVFKMIPDESIKFYDDLPLYLHLYNVHNGYYSKGFTFSFDGKTKNEGRV